MSRGEAVRERPDRRNSLETGADEVLVAVLVEHLEELEVRLGSLDRDDVGVEALDVVKDEAKVRVACGWRARLGGLGPEKFASIVR